MSGDVATSRSERFKRNQESFRLAKQKLLELDAPDGGISNGDDNTNKSKNPAWQERKEKDETRLDYYVNKSPRKTKETSADVTRYNLKETSPEKFRKDPVRMRSNSRSKVVLSLKLTEEKSVVESITVQQSNSSPTDPAALQLHSPDDPNDIEQPFKKLSKHRNSMSSVVAKLPSSPRTIGSGGVTRFSRPQSMVEPFNAQQSIKPRSITRYMLDKTPGDSANVNDRHSLKSPGLENVKDLPRTNNSRIVFERPKKHTNNEIVNRSPRNPAVKHSSNSNTHDVATNRADSNPMTDRNIIYDATNQTFVNKSKINEIVHANTRYSKTRGSINSPSNRDCNPSDANVSVMHVVLPAASHSRRVVEYTDTVLDMFSDSPSTSPRVPSISPRVSSSPTADALEDDEPDIELFSSFRRKMMAGQKQQQADSLNRKSAPMLDENKDIPPDVNVTAASPPMMADQAQQQADLLNRKSASMLDKNEDVPPGGPNVTAASPLPTSEVFSVPRSVLNRHSVDNPTTSRASSSKRLAQNASGLSARTKPVPAERAKPVPTERAKPVPADRAKPVPAARTRPFSAEKTAKPVPPSPPLDFSLPINERSLMPQDDSTKVDNRVTLIDDPLMENSQNVSMTNAVVDAPVTQATVNASVIQATVNAPVTQDTVNALVTQATVNAPVTQATVNVPFIQTSVNAPVNQASINAPVTRAMVNASDTQATVNAPVTQAAINALVTRTSVKTPVTQSAFVLRASRNLDGKRRTVSKVNSIEGKSKSPPDVLNRGSISENQNKAQLASYKKREYSAEPRPINRRSSARDNNILKKNESDATRPLLENKSPVRPAVSDLQINVTNVVLPVVKPLKQNKTNINAKPPLPKRGTTIKPGNKSDPVHKRSASVSGGSPSKPESSKLSQRGASPSRSVADEPKKSFRLPWNKIYRGPSSPEKEKKGRQSRVGERLSNGHGESLKRVKSPDIGSSEIPTTLDVEAMVKESLLRLALKDDRKDGGIQMTSVKHHHSLDDSDRASPASLDDLQLEEWLEYRPPPPPGDTSFKRTISIDGSSESISKPGGDSNWRRSVSRRWSQIRRAVSLDRVDKAGEKQSDRPTTADRRGATVGTADTGADWRSNGTDRRADRSASNISDESEEFTRFTTRRSPLRRTSSFRALISAITPKSRQKYSTGEATSKEHRRLHRSSSATMTSWRYSPSVDSSPTHFRPIARIIAFNPNDQQRTIELIRPPHGPFGFYIEQGIDEYQDSVFVSRLSDGLPEKFFAGLLSVGDEILEINDTCLRFIDINTIHDLMADPKQTRLVLRILPIALRSKRK